MDFSFIKEVEFWIVAFVIPFLMQKYFIRIDSTIVALTQFVIVRLPSSIRMWKRSRKAKYLRKLKVDRWSTSRIIFEISKTNTMFMLFCGVIGMYLISLIAGGASGFIESNFLLGLLFTTPIYMVEAVWLKQDLRTKSLLRSREKIRRKSTFN